VQTTGVPPQTPAVHTSGVVHRFPSLQLVPFGRFAYVQVLPFGTPAAWHWSGAGQTIGVPTHVPFEQASFAVELLPSLQPVPFGALA
jgi:hypothetical protein